MLLSLEAHSLTHGQYDELSVCWNNLFRRIFNMHKWESVKEIQFFCGSLAVTRLSDLQRLRFPCKMPGCQNVILKECFYRAIHFSAKRGIAIACRLSVCPSVRLSVCL